MRITNTRTWPAFLLAIAGLAFPTLAQEGATTAELRRVIARLEAENAELRAMILEERSRAEAERVRATELERAVEALQADLAAARRPAGQPAPAEPPAAIPLDRFASPASMHAWLERRYADDVAPLPRRDEAEIAQARDHARQWCARMDRELRGKGSWIVSLAPAPRIEGEPEAVLVAVLDENGRVIGAPFRSVLPPRMLDRAREAWGERKPGEPRDTWEAGVMLNGHAIFDPDRSTRGVYDTPAFIGPYCAFEHEVEWTSLKLRPAPAPAATPRPPR